ncbi:MAG: methylamine utilization protein MauJ [Candidatus Hodarchaeota archaeon]
MKKTRYRKDIRYFIDMVGMASACVGSVAVDGKYALIQVPPTYSIAVAPPAGEKHPSFREVVFYTNCLAYEHDLPAFITPVKRRALVRSVEKGRKKYINDSYYQSLEMAYEALNCIRLGPLGYVYFRWPGFRKEVDIPYRKKYSGAAKELSLYSTAVRQLDPLSEFLCYYRVIESMTGTNGKEWISKNLPRLGNYNFGFLEFGTDARAGPPIRRTNVFSIYKRRALARIKDLKSKRGEKSLANYFYNENRCGIAHGKSDVKEYDFKYNIEEVSKDAFILKLLSRIAIEDKI